MIWFEPQQTPIWFEMNFYVEKNNDLFLFVDGIFRFYHLWGIVQVPLKVKDIDELVSLIASALENPLISYHKSFELFKHETSMI